MWNQKTDWNKCVLGNKKSMGFQTRWLAAQLLASPFLHLGVLGKKKKKDTNEHRQTKMNSWRKELSKPIWTAALRFPAYLWKIPGQNENLWHTWQCTEVQSRWGKIVRGISRGGFTIGHSFILIWTNTEHCCINVYTCFGWEWDGKATFIIFL